MRKIFAAHSKTATELFYLETGKIPLRFIILKRRLMYLWHILTRDETELIHKVYSTQKYKTTKGDWYEVIEQVKKTLRIEISDQEIKSMKKDAFKNVVDKKVNIAAHQYLQMLASKHSKSKFAANQSTELEKQQYLSDKRFSRKDIQVLFALKTRMLNLKNNFKNLYNNNLQCQTCDVEEFIEDENHILNCENLRTKESSTIKMIMYMEISKIN